MTARAPRLILIFTFLFAAFRVDLPAHSAASQNAASQNAAFQNAASQGAAGAKTPAQPDRDRLDAIYRRYVSVLRRTPRSGTAFDKVYSHHQDLGTLPEFVTSLQNTVTADPEDGSSWMILGLVEQRQGHHAAARDAFRSAEKYRPDDPLASWYLGQTLMSLGHQEAAAEAFQEALQRSPSRPDQLEIFQQLGRVYQKLQQRERALQLWRRFESAFPEDESVQAQITEALLQSGQLQEALTRVSARAARTTAPVDRIQLQVKAAEIRMQLGQLAEAREELATLSEQIKPGSWLFDDVRRRIDESYLQTNDLTGLIEYYEDWLVRHPTDLDAMTRLARWLAKAGRSDAAVEWWQQAIQKAPADGTIRESLIRHLVDQQQYAAAISQYEDFAAAASLTSDQLEDWGQLYLRRDDLPLQQRQTRAAQVWQQLISAADPDPITVSRVARLLRQAGLIDDARQTYEQAIRLAPDDLSHREDLGAFLHELKRPSEAIAVWRTMATDERRTTGNLRRLSDVCHTYGYLDDAVAAINEACELNPQFDDRVRFSALLREQRRIDDSLQQLVQAEQLAETDEQREQVMRERITTLQTGDRLAGRAAELRRDLDALTEAAASSGQPELSERWRVLALYYDALNSLTEASRAADMAVRLAPTSVVAWKASARILERAGLTSEAAAANSRLVDLDPRFRSEYLKKVAELESNLGRVDRALQAAERLIALAPDNAEYRQFHAELCFRLGRPDAATESLRQAVALNPSSPQALSQLAETLAASFRTDEAIELYWRAFQETEKAEARTAIVHALTDLYIRTSRFDELVAQLQTIRQTSPRPRDLTLCMAVAHRHAGDTAMAGQLLEEVLAQHGEVAEVLEQLSSMSEQTSDLVAAAEYQRRLNAVRPTVRGTQRLARLMLQSGRIDAAQAAWMRLSDSPSPNITAASAEADVSRVFASTGQALQASARAAAEAIATIDEFITANQLAPALDLAQRMLDRNGADWEALLRIAVIHRKAGRRREAMDACRQLLALPPGNDQLSWRRQAEVVGRAAGDSVSADATSAPPLLLGSRGPQAFSKTFALGWTSRVSDTDAWQAVDLSDGRRAAIWLKMEAAADDGNLATLFSQLLKAAEDAVASQTQPVWDAWYAADAWNIWDNTESDKRAALITLLSRLEDLQAHFAVLHAVAKRSSSEQSDSAPLSSSQLVVLQKSWNRIRTERPQWLVYSGGPGPVIGEFALAGQPQQGQTLLSELMRPEATWHELAAALQYLSDGHDPAARLRVAERLALSPDAARYHSIVVPTWSELLTRITVEAAKQNDRKLFEQAIVLFLKIRAEESAVSTRHAAGTAISVSLFTKAYHTIRPGSDATSLQFSTLAFDDYWPRLETGFLVNLHQLPSIPLSETIAMIRKFRDSTSGRGAVVAELAIAHLLYLKDDRESAIVHLIRAAQLAPDHAILRIRLATWLRDIQREAEALALLDTVKAVDHDMIRERDLLTLELATKLGNTVRARQAAGRLFGLRLDSKTSLSLAATMKNLGMSDMADAIQQRIRHEAGNDLPQLFSLMNASHQNGNLPMATEIAHQVLRQTEKMTHGPQTGESLESIRSTAIRVLAESDQLSGLIERADEQLQRSPDSVALHETLQEYYAAAGRTTDAARMTQRLQQLRPETIDTLLQAAQALDNRKQYREACEKYLQVLQKDPQRFSQNYYQFLRSFRAGRQLPELADVLMKGDLRSLQNNYFVVSETIQTLFAAANRDTPDSAERRKALQLFEAAWKAFPYNRAFLLTEIHDDSVWQLPLMIQYAREGLIPATPQDAAANPWKVIVGRLSYSGRGRVRGTLNRLCEALDRQQQVAEFRSTVATAVAKFPAWHGGRLLLAVLHEREGALDAAAAELKNVTTSNEVPVIPLEVAWVVASELSDRSMPLLPQVTKLLAETLSGDARPEERPYDETPARLLADLYVRQQQNREARQQVEIALKRASLEKLAERYDSDIAAARQHELVAAGRHLLEMGFPLSAWHLFAIAKSETPSSSHLVSAAQLSALEHQAAARLNVAHVMAYLREATADFQNASTATPSMNLMLIPPTSADQPVRSVVLEGMKTLKFSSQELPPLRAAAERLLADSADRDAAPAVFAVGLAAITDDAELMARGFDALKRNLDATASRSAAVPDELSMWLAARIALQSQRTELAARLADRAAAAADLSENRFWLQSLLWERGRLALRADDRQAAEQAWYRLLDAVLDDQPQAPPAAGTTEETASDAAPSSLQELRTRLLDSLTD
ncbi:MAG: tetratricopeptide repeat protein [Fuerstiella sp.]